MEIRKSENHRALPTASNFSLFFVIFVELFRRNFLVLRALLVSVQRKMFTTEHFRFTKHGRLFAKAHCTCSMHRGALAVYPGLSDCAALSPRSLVEVIRNFTRVLITFDNFLARNMGRCGVDLITLGRDSSGRGFFRRDDDIDLTSRRLKNGEGRKHRRAGKKWKDKKFQNRLIGTWCVICVNRTAAI